MLSMQTAFKLLNESKSLLLDDCIGAFGEDTVFSSEKLLKLDRANFNALFKILDKHVFNSSLASVEKLKTFIGSPAQLNPALLSYSHSKLVDLKDYIALYQPEQCWHNGALTIAKDAIFLNSESNAAASFSYAASALCHEMIHAFDMHFSQLLNYITWALKAGAPPEVIDYNSHFTKTFQQKQREFMDKTSIPIPISGEGRDFDTLCRDMAQNIHLLKESEASSQLPFSKETIEKYKDSKLVSISDDGMSFSFSFGIPMPE